MNVAYIYVTYNETEENKKQIIKEIKALGFENLKIYHVDNLKNNIGYAAGVNKGINEALNNKADIFIISNPDISLKGLKSQDFIKLSKHFDIGGFTFVQDDKIYYGGAIDRWRMSGGLISEKPKKRFVSCDFVSGSLMVIKKEVIEKIGLLSEDYFLYYEEVDYCFRAKEEGFKIGLDSKKEYTHFEVTKRNPKKEKYLERNRIKFLLKYGSIWQKMYEVARLPKSILELITRRINFQFRSGFLIDFFSLNASSFLSKVLNFILFIFLIRYLKPSEYGIYTLVWAQVSIFSPLVDLGTTTYGIVNLPKESNKKIISLYNLRILASFITYIFTIFVSLIIFRGNNMLIFYIFLTSFILFSNMFSGTYLIINAIFGKLLNSSIVSTIFNLFLIASLILSLTMFKSLTFLFFLIFIFYNLYSLINYFLIRKDLKKYNFRFDFAGWIKLLQKSYIFVLISFFSGLYSKLDVFLLQFFKGSKDVGIYSAGYSFFEALIFIAASYNIARTPIFSKLVKTNVSLFLKKIKKDFFYLLLLGILIVIFTELFGPLILPLFIKGNYLESINVVKIVIFTLPLILLNSIFLNVLYVLKRAKLVIYVFLFQTTVNFILNFLFIPRYSYIASSYITVFAELLNVIILFLLVLRYFPRYENSS